MAQLEYAPEKHSLRRSIAFFMMVECKSHRIESDTMQMDTNDYGIELCEC